MITASAPIASDAWISPDGKFYPVKYGNHWSTAHSILNPSCQTPMDCWLESADSKCPNNFGSGTLEKQGWLHISGGNIDHNPRHEITNRQVDVLFEMRDHIANSDFTSRERFLDNFRRIFATTKEAEQFAAF